VRLHPLHHEQVKAIARVLVSAPQRFENDKRSLQRRGMLDRAL